ncbi:MAG TPA: nucleotide exchange factor GrpE [Verrucomicrobiales bacterium]|nr:nucleotide exchange factor GrpE [Verrucomicrobiales bacterium]|tara:strand:- start:287 stop:892 length:606 start_codon:yes stop_codon:yes gene_type:complete
MKFWNMGKDKEEKQADSGPEMTALEKRLAEKAAQEPDEETPAGPGTMDEARAEIGDLSERLLRLQADFENFRKRAQREKDEARQFANQSLIEKQLPILDNFEMALAAAKDADPALRDGVQMIYDQLLGILRDSGVETIDATGEDFDPNLHEAISQQETTEAEPGTVVEQVQRGYRLHERLVRPARVVVAKAPEAAEQSPED